MMAIPELTIGEIKYLPRIKIYDTDDPTATVTLTSYVFDVVDNDGTEVQASGNCAITGNGTAAVYLYCKVDATSGFTAGESYQTRITYSDGTETLKLIKPFKVGDIVL